MRRRWPKDQEAEDAAVGAAVEETYKRILSGGLGCWMLFVLALICLIVEFTISSRRPLDPRAGLGSAVGPRVCNVAGMVTKYAK